MYCDQVKVSTELSETVADIKHEYVKTKKVSTVQEFINECHEIVYWIYTKKAVINIDDEAFEDIARRVEVLQQHCFEIHMEKAERASRVFRINEFAEELMANGEPEGARMIAKKDKVNEVWKQLELLEIQGQKRLLEAIAVQNFEFIVDEAVSWIEDGNFVIWTYESGSKISDVEALRNIELRLSKMRDDVISLEAEAYGLLNALQLAECDLDLIRCKRAEIREFWMELVDTARNRLINLDEDYNFHLTV